MFISRKRVREIEDRIDKRTHEADFNFWKREVYELRNKVRCLEEFLGVYYDLQPSKAAYCKKGGPERA